MFSASLTKPSGPSKTASNGEPLSTTKALMLSITIPRVHHVYLPPPDPEDDNDTACSVGANNQKDESSGRIVRETAFFESDRRSLNSANNTERQQQAQLVVVNLEGSGKSDTWTEQDIHYVEHDEEGVEDILTPEEMATVVKINAVREEDEYSRDEELGHEKIVNYGALEEEIIFEQAIPSKKAIDGHSVSSATSSISNTIRSYVFGVVNKNEDEQPTQFLNREQSIAAIKECDSFPIEDGLAPNTAIKVEELLRLTFRNLFSEGHFYNAPIFTAVESRADPDAEIEDWVEVAVMIKDPSVGIILERLERIGVGSSVGTIAIYKAELCRSVGVAQPSQDETEATEDSSTGNHEPIVAQKENEGKNSAFEDEWKVAASRLRVEQVKEQIHEQAHLSLDYISLLTIASILAGVGLITNSVVVIVASMLVSPIMGPVMGMTFGSRVSDWNLARWSFLHECFSLAVCFIVGFMIAMTSFWTNIAEEWPTDEMAGRGDTTGLLTGIAIAVPSGMGVALSILGNNTSSLVGVAISASLLPPAVNCGICWGYALLVRTGAVEDDSGADFIEIGGISFALTVVNIVCIWFSGMLMFAVKEVAPSRTKSAFWARDIKVARAIQKGSRKVNVEVIKEGIQNALKSKQGPGSIPKRELKKVKKSLRYLESKQSGNHVAFDLQPIDDDSDEDDDDDGRPTLSVRQLSRALGCNFSRSEDSLPGFHDRGAHFRSTQLDETEGNQTGGRYLAGWFGSSP